MVQESRRLAKTGYSRLFEEALRVGRPIEFAHQAGVLDAAFCVFANSDAMRKHDGIGRVLQREVMPFNLAAPDNGDAISEYLLWKIFPEEADLAKIMPAIQSYTQRVVDDAESEADPDAFMKMMLTPGQFEWEALTERALQSLKPHA